tara:strand:+ start:331 stop:1068 length:738 start_codon:yes stop_codon:yes gene_type:complete
MLSILIPTFQEESSIKYTLMNIHSNLSKTNIEFEIIVIDDHSDDDTQQIISKLTSKYDNISFHVNDSKRGFGNSIVKGILISKGSLITIMMADSSDSVDDLIRYYEVIKADNKLDCVFGDRWSNNSVRNYPILKRVINRLGNYFLSLVFGVNYSDFTNSFKLYKKQTLMEIFPIISNHFSITLELPLKIITRKYKFKVISNSWENREHGISKMRIVNSLLTYSMIAIYCYIDLYFWSKRYDLNNR